MGVIQDIETGNFSQLWADIKKSWETSSFGSLIDSAASSAWTELQTVAPTDLESAAAATATAILTALTGGSPTAAIISAGITEAESAFLNAGKQITSSTVATFVSAVHSQASASAAAVASAPAPASDTLVGTAS